MTYQKSDQSFVDYQVYKWGRLDQLYRGPAPDLGQPYIACLGAAQTFGRYAERPYPTLLARTLGMQVANFGTGGAGSGFFLRDSMVLEAASNAQLCIVQVMSARAISNRMFKVQPQRNAQINAVSQALEDLFPHVDFETFTHAHNMLNEISDADPNKFQEVEAEMKTAWIARTKVLLQSIKTRKLLFWFSERAPNETTRHHDNRTMLRYPQFLDQHMLDAVRPFADGIVYCISTSGMPQSLLVDGQPVLQTPFGIPVTENRYYPSPEMHEEAAQALVKPVRELLTRRPRAVSGQQGQKRA
ncbi:MAG: DUF6473 family protein [Pseudomonadota bacterium]